MIVFLLGFSKKKNSTIKPVLTGAVQLTCQLKEETSVVNPTIIINPNNAVFTSPFTPSAYNYAYIPQFQRYYFINDWRYNVATWEAFLNVDVLASFKESIALETCYIERSSNTFNGDLIDTLYPAKTNVQITGATVATSWANVAPSGGCYILGVINYQPGGRIGAISYYATDTTGLNNLLSYLFSNNIYNAGNITEIGEGLFKSLFDPFQYIVSCMWMPGNASIYGSTQTTIKVGYWDTLVSAYSCEALADVRFITGLIPNHPQISRGAYLNFAPYTRITLFCPPFGEIPIDATFTRNGRYLYAKVVGDPITGQATMRIAFRTNDTNPYDGRPCFEKTAMFGVPIQLAQVLSDYTGAASTLASSISGGIAGFVMGAIGATVQSAIAAQSPKVSTNGANGSFINFALEPSLVVEHTLLADEDNSNLGRPLLANKQISTIPGYIKCVEAHYSGVCFDSEKELINQFMINGFYYE